MVGVFGFLLTLIVSAPRQTEPKRSGTDQEREMQASLLMEEFLTARRRERQQEQTSMVQDLQIRAAKPKGADADDDEITAKLSLL